MYPPLAPAGQLAEVPIGDVRTEAGAIIPNVTVAYQRWGRYRVNEDGTNNVLLVEHALTGDSNAADWWGDLIGAGKALDTDHWCVICTNVLGGCKGTTGPSSVAPDGQPWGSRFPAISVRDQVSTEKQFLDALGITRVAAVIGGSMGGARTLEWAYMYPGVVGAACVIAVSARASAWQIGIQAPKSARSPATTTGLAETTTVGPPPSLAYRRPDASPTSPTEVNKKLMNASAPHPSAAKTR